MSVSANKLVEQVAQSEAAAGTVIREFYNDFVPPRYVRRLVGRMVSSVPTKYLQGLDCVVLTNQSGHPRRYRLGKVTSRRRRVPQSRVLGRYYRAHHGKPAWIELFVDNLSAVVSLHPFFPFFRTAVFGNVLFHEIGHHIDATIRPEFREKEDVADSWSKKLLKLYFRERYRFPRPVSKLIGWMLKAIAQEFK
jgi:hypothetical protein